MTPAAPRVNRDFACYHDRAMTFRDKALAVVRRIPKGKVMTYKEVAAQAGNPRAARGVGSMMRVNHDPLVPCHRVVRSDLRVGNYNRPGGQKTKIRRLKTEGVRVDGDTVMRRAPR